MERENQAMLRADREARAAANWPLQRERGRANLLRALADEVRQHTCRGHKFSEVACRSRKPRPLQESEGDAVLLKDTGVPVSAFRQMGLTGTCCSPEEARFAATLSRVTAADARVISESRDD